MVVQNQRWASHTHRYAAFILHAWLNAMCLGMELDPTMEEMMEREAQQEQQWEIDDMAEGEPSC